MGAMPDIPLESVSRDIRSLKREDALKPGENQGMRCAV
jgi:hypothetical protein